MCLLSIIIFALFLSSNGFSQVNATYWGVEDTTLQLSKHTNSGTVNDYLEWYNYSGQDLNMR